LTRRRSGAGEKFTESDFGFHFIYALHDARSNSIQSFIFQTNAPKFYFNPLKFNIINFGTLGALYYSACSSRMEEQLP
jgi:hypothetical protein